jgi:hypothetical protein
MKRKLIAIVLALFSISGLVAVAPARSLPSNRPEPPSPTFAISPYGTLLGVFDANGTSRFGNLAFDGFWVRYIANGTLRSALAVGSTTHIRLRPGQVDSDGRSATVTVRTADNRLEITSQFSLDDDGKTLIIRRRFRNISSGNLMSFVSRQYVDGKLISEPGTLQSNLLQKALLRIRTGNAGDCMYAECPGGRHPCLIINCPNPTPWLSSVGGLRLQLQWKPRTLNKLLIGPIPQQANEFHRFIRVNLED